jgi:hypothetical protein
MALRQLITAFCLLLAISHAGVFTEIAFAADRAEKAYSAHTRAYRKAVQRLALTSKQALRIARQVGPGCGQSGFDPQPGMLVGTHYLFAAPHKTRHPLTGLYIDGNTGRAERRESQQQIAPGRARVKASDYTAIIPCVQDGTTSG